MSESGGWSSALTIVRVRRQTKQSLGRLEQQQPLARSQLEPPSQQQPPPQQPQQQSLGRLPLEPPSQLPQLQQPQPQQPQPQQPRSFCTYFRYVTPSLPLPEPAAWRQPFALFLSAHAELKSLADGVGVGAYAYVGKAYVHWVTKGKHTEAELVAKVWSELQAKDRMFCEQACKKCYKKSRKYINK